MKITKEVQKKGRNVWVEFVSGSNSFCVLGFEWTGQENVAIHVMDELRTRQAFGPDLDLEAIPHFANAVIRRKKLATYCRLIGAQYLNGALTLLGVGDFRGYINNKNCVHSLMEQTIQNCSDDLLQGFYGENNFKKTHPNVLIFCLGGYSHFEIWKKELTITSPFEVLLLSNGFHLGEDEQKIFAKAERRDFGPIAEESALFISLKVEL